jgi:hypothetical protein
MPEFTLTLHAESVMMERGIPTEWVRRILAKPTRLERDRFDPQLQHALGRISEHGDRVLRIVYDPSIAPIRVVTAYFDRSLRNRL